MAVDLIRALVLSAVVGGLAGPALALGPNAPFTPVAPVAPVAPLRAALDTGAPDAGADALPGQAGLAGLRLRNHPMALIDGRWSRIGDTVRGARLDTIDPQGAVLRHADGRRERLPWSSKTPDAAPAVASNSVRTSTP